MQTVEGTTHFPHFSKLTTIFIASSMDSPLTPNHIWDDGEERGVGRRRVRMDGRGTIPKSGEGDPSNLTSQGWEEIVLTCQAPIPPVHNTDGEQ